MPIFKMSQPALLPAQVTTTRPSGSSQVPARAHEVGRLKKCTSRLASRQPNLPITVNDYNVRYLSVGLSTIGYRIV